GDAAARLEASIDKWLPQNQAIALYWLGRAQTAANRSRERQRGVLTLLRLPALFGREFPDLAGAGLYYAMTTLKELKDEKASGAVRRELLLRYAHTLYGAKVKAGDKDNK
ncbi:MAG: hypothetical protein IH991_03405, partial [Planctomycetes bacterium]|nr:hypothetical protein [Planctomycetota bacterium]